MCRLPPSYSVLINLNNVESRPLVRLCHRHDSWIRVYQNWSPTRIQTHHAHTHLSHTLDLVHQQTHANLGCVVLQQHSLICKPDCSLSLLVLAMIRGCHLWLHTFVSSKQEKTAWLALPEVSFGELRWPQMEHVFAVKTFNPVLHSIRSYASLTFKQVDGWQNFWIAIQM